MNTELVELINTFPGARVEWEDKLRVKMSPHLPPTDIYGVKMFNNFVYYKRYDGQHQLLDCNEQIAGSLLQRLKLIQYESDQKKTLSCSSK